MCVNLFGKLFGSKPKVNPVHIETRADFQQEVLKSNLPVIVDVWGPSCPPCKKLVPVLINVATKYDGRVRVAELSTEAEPRLLAQLNVRSTPTLLVFSQGKELGRMSGYRPEGWFDEMIEAEFPE